MAIFGTNCTIGPEGLCPIIMVFGIIPKPARKPSYESQTVGENAIENGMKEDERIQAQKRISFARKHPKSLKAGESSTKLRHFPAGPKVYVYRDTKRGWRGPLTFVSVSGETKIVQFSKGHKSFRNPCVRPMI